MEEIEADLLAKLSAEKAAEVPNPSFTPPSRLRFSGPVGPRRVPVPVLTKYQARRLRTEELRKEREDKERRAAGLLALAAELKARREAQEKAAAERKAKGVKISYEDWRRSEWGE